MEPGQRRTESISLAQDVSHGTGSERFGFFLMDNGLPDTAIWFSSLVANSPSVKQRSQREHPDGSSSFQHLSPQHRKLTAMSLRGWYPLHMLLQYCCYHVRFLSPLHSPSLPSSMIRYNKRNPDPSLHARCQAARDVLEASR